jgi:hypothetical protein
MRRSNHLGTVVIGLLLCGGLLGRGSAAWAAERGNDANGKKLFFCASTRAREHPAPAPLVDAVVLRYTWAEW